MRTRWLVGSLSMLVVLLAGCGDKNGSQAGTTLPASTSTSSAPSTTAAGTSTSAGGTTTTAPQDPAKAAKAKAAVLQAGDFPAGFKENEDPLDQDTTFRDIVTCLGLNVKGQGSAASPTYVRGVATQVTSSVEYFAAADAESIARGFAGNPKFTECSTTAFNADVKRNAPEGFDTGAVEIAPLDFPKSGQLTSAYRIKAAVGPIQIVQDFVVVFNGGAVTRFTFLSPGQPFPADLAKTLVEKVVARAGT